MNPIITRDCSECFSYKNPGFIDNCCAPNVCHTSTFQTPTTQRSLLLANQNQLYQCNYVSAVTSTLQYTQNNTSKITDILYGQILELKKARYQPYQPYIPPVVPPSVIQLEQKSVNVGVPHSVFTIADCIGSQSVTTTKRIIY